jgi:hypothetical protein
LRPALVAETAKDVRVLERCKSITNRRSAKYELPEMISFDLRDRRRQGYKSATNDTFFGLEHFVSILIL